jgi:hypothetical protein
MSKYLSIALLLSAATSLHCVTIVNNTQDTILLYNFTYVANTNQEQNTPKKITLQSNGSQTIDNLGGFDIELNGKITTQEANFDNNGIVTITKLENKKVREASSIIEVEVIKVTYTIIESEVIWVDKIPLYNDAKKS